MNHSGSSRPPSASGPMRLDDVRDDRAARDTTATVLIRASAGASPPASCGGGARRAAAASRARECSPTSAARLARAPARRAGATGTSTSAIAAPRAASRDAAAADLLDEQREEERRVDRVEADRVRVAEHVAGERADDRPADPADVLDRARAEQQPAVERPVAARRRSPTRRRRPSGPGSRGGSDRRGATGPSATPIGRKREFMSAAAPIAAAATVPPCSQDRDGGELRRAREDDRRHRDRGAGSQADKAFQDKVRAAVAYARDLTRRAEADGITGVRTRVRVRCMSKLVVERSGPTPVAFAPAVQGPGASGEKGGPHLDRGLLGQSRPAPRAAGAGHAGLQRRPAAHRSVWALTATSAQTSLHQIASGPSCGGRSFAFHRSTCRGFISPLSFTPANQRDCVTAVGRKTERAEQSRERTGEGNPPCHARKAKSSRAPATAH